MDRLAENAIQCVIVIGQCLWEHSEYITRQNRIVGEMKKSMEELVAMKKDIENRSRGKEWSSQEELWLGRVVNMQGEVDEIEKRSKENRRWLFCPDLFWRYSVAKEAEDKKDDIERHKKDWESVAMTGNPPSVDASTSAGPVALVKDRTNPGEGLSSLLPALLDSTYIIKHNLSDQNLVNGSIPSLGGLTQRESPDRSRNSELSGSPFKKGDLVNLLDLDLYYCKRRKGTSPAALGGLKHKKSLTRSANSKPCEPPSEMAELVNLRYLDLNGYVSVSFKLTITSNSTVGSK